MPNLKTSSKDVGRGGQRSKPNEGCKRHPKHKQSPGVCSLCLAEKLSRLSTHWSTLASCCCSSSSSSSSSYSYSYSSSSSSSCSSCPFRPPRFTADGKGSSFSFLLFKGKDLHTKSRSVACASGMRRKEGDGDDHKKMKGGFLSRLFHTRNTKTKEQGSSTAVFA